MICKFNINIIFSICFNIQYISFLCLKSRFSYTNTIIQSLSSLLVKYALILYTFLYLINSSFACNGETYSTCYLICHWVKFLYCISNMSNKPGSLHSDISFLYESLMVVSIFSSVVQVCNSLTVMNMCCAVWDSNTIQCTVSTEWFCVMTEIGDLFSWWHLVW